MKFIVNSSALLKHLQQISGVINTNTVLPILEDFLFEIQDEKLTVIATDLETVMHIRMEVKSKTNGKVCIPARILLDSLKNIGDQPLTFNIDKNMDKNQKYVALVTGATGGLGTAMCKKLLKDGFRVVGNYVTPEKAEKWTKQMKKSDLITAIASHANLTKADAGRALDGITQSIQSALKSGDSVALVGFGTFEVKERIGVLSYSSKGWSKQLNLVSWNGRDAKYDIRDWDENLEKMGRGVSLSREELLNLRDCLDSLQFEFEISSSDIEVEVIQA
jgi:hypothetical protein